MRVTGPYLLGMHPDPVLLIWCCTEDEDDLEGDFVGHSGDYWQDGDWTFDVKMPEAWEPVGIRTKDLMDAYDPQTLAVIAGRTRTASRFSTI